MKKTSVHWKNLDLQRTNLTMFVLNQLIWFCHQNRPCYLYDVTLQTDCKEIDVKNGFHICLKSLFSISALRRLTALCNPLPYAIHCYSYLTAFRTPVINQFSADTYRRSRKHTTSSTPCILCTNDQEDAKFSYQHLVPDKLQKVSPSLRSLEFITTASKLLFRLKMAYHMSLQKQTKIRLRPEYPSSSWTGPIATHKSYNFSEARRNLNCSV